MPFVRVSRDKRGYEQISLVHVSARRGRPSKSRVLYVFRTPPGVKVGREPFDEAIQHELEARNPEIVFDWKALSNIPVPAPDVEFWRERRKAEKAAKLARRAEDLVSDAADGLEPAEHPALDTLGLAVEGIPVVAIRGPAVLDAGDATVRFDTASEIVASESVGIDGQPAGHGRRRRGGRQRHRGGQPQVLAASPPHASAAAPTTPATAGGGGPAAAPTASEPSGDPSKLA